jgi:hypothetical protein
MQEKKILLLGSMHGWDIESMLQQNVGIEYEDTSTFKPSAPLVNVVQDLGESW